MAAEPSPATDRPVAAQALRLLDAVPVVALTAAGLVLVLVMLRALLFLNRPFYLGNRETIGLLATLTVYLAFGAGLGLALKRFRDPVAFLRLRWPTPRAVFICLLALIPWFIAVALVSVASAVLFNGGRPLPSNTRQLFVQVPHGIGLLLLALLVSAVAAPICEEIFFRGMVFRYLRARWPLWAAAPVSALVFGAAHVNPASGLLIVPVIAFIGLMLALVYERTGSLTNSILMHALNNGVLTVIVFVVLSQ